MHSLCTNRHPQSHTHIHIKETSWRYHFSQFDCIKVWHFERFCAFVLVSTLVSLDLSAHIYTNRRKGRLKIAEFITGFRQLDWRNVEIAHVSMMGFARVETLFLKGRCWLQGLIYTNKIYKTQTDHVKIIELMEDLELLWTILTTTCSLEQTLLLRTLAVLF